MALEFRNLTFGYGEPVFRNLDLQVADGEFVSILGPSGCGKSTLLKVLGGILKPDSGEIMMDGAMGPAMMPQEDLLFPWLTILDNALLYARLHGKKQESMPRAKAGLELFGLGGYEQNYPSELSGGMRQRAAFLRTALCPAEILLLDEPFASLDVLTRHDMQRWLASMRQELRRTILLVTHDLDEALYLSDRLILMSQRPADFIFEHRIEVPIAERTPRWLAEQTGLKEELYKLLKN